MKRSLFCFILLCILSIGCQTGHDRCAPGMAEGLLDLSDTLSLGLQKCEQAEWIEVFRSDGYVNNVVLTSFKGSFYCMWQQSERDEDTPDTRVMLSVSEDGKNWSAPSVLVPPTQEYFASPGGWIRNGDTLTALVNYTYSPDRSQGGKAYFISTVDGLSWTEPQPVLMADGSPVEGIFEQDPLKLPEGRITGAVHFRPGNVLCPVYTDDPSGVKGWKKASFPEGEGHPIEPSQYIARDGTLVMFMRDQNSSFVKLYSVSKDRGESWSAPQKTDIPDSRSKQCTGNLPDGKAFWVGNPTGNKSRRALVLAISENGYLYDSASLLASPADMPAKRKAGLYKTLGYNYPKATVIGDDIWISLSVNKEDVALIRISLRSAIV